MAGQRTLGTTLTKTMSGVEVADTIIANLTSIGEVGLESSEIETTTLSSTGGYKEFIAGTKDAGSVDLEGNVVEGDDSNALMLALADDRTVEEWTIETPAGATWVFDAYVSSFMGGARTVEGLETFKSTLRLSGKPVYTPASS